MNPETTLRKNTAVWDRVLRVGLAGVFIWLGATTSWGPWTKSLVAAFGGVQLLVGLSGY